MSLKYLENAFYMNIETGSVAHAQEWEADFLESGDSCFSEWSGGVLVQVEEDKNGNWIEV